MEINAPNHRTKLRATVARRASSRENDTLNYDAEPEPNMRLSRAIAVVLILHIVAIGGVLAFSLIKDRAPQPTTRSKIAMPTPGAASSATVPNPNLTPAAIAPNKRNDAVGTPAERILPVSTSIANPTTAAKPTKTTTYTVRNGDTLARVATENGVSLGALIAANNASVTTTSLKPGQEIQIPVIGAPKEKPQDEATRLIETGGASAPAKAAIPASIVAKPSTAAPPPATLVAKQTTPPLPVAPPGKSSPPTPAAEKATTPTPLATKPAAPTPTVERAPAKSPRIEKAIPVTASPKPASGSASWEDKTYVVQAGDNPTKLAKKFGISENALLKANGITDPRKLQVGQRLVIPSRKPKSN